MRVPICACRISGRSHLHQRHRRQVQTVRDVAHGVDVRNICLAEVVHFDCAAVLQLHPRCLSARRRPPNVCHGKPARL